MYAAIVEILIALFTPFIQMAVNHKKTAVDAPDNPHRERWLYRVRKFKNSIRS